MIYSYGYEKQYRRTHGMDILSACGNKTRLQIWEDTELKNFPLYCPKCKRETLIEVKELQITVIKEPDA